MRLTAHGLAGRAWLPVVRRVMQVGHGPPALAGWLRARGVALAPRPVWTPADERAARELARQLDDVVWPHAGGGRLPPLTHQPQDTLLAEEPRVEGR
jgi:hypothetical protein